jgi:hypothetical protein
MSEHKLRDEQERKFQQCWVEIKEVLARYGLVIVHRSMVINGQPQTSELVLIPEPSKITIADPTQLPRDRLPVALRQ